MLLPLHPRTREAQGGLRQPAKAGAKPTEPSGGMHARVLTVHRTRVRIVRRRWESPSRLTGDRKGAYAIAVSARYRIVFHYEDGDVYDVEVIDYHKS